MSEFPAPKIDMAMGGVRFFEAHHLLMRCAISQGTQLRRGAPTILSGLDPDVVLFLQIRKVQA
jgi:hypothetical protein